VSLATKEVLEEPYADWAQELRTYGGRVIGANLEAADAALAEREPGTCSWLGEADPLTTRQHSASATRSTRRALNRIRRRRLSG
jgi:hypothetical protein